MPRIIQTTEMEQRQSVRRLAVGLTIVVLLSTVGACGEGATPIDSPVTEEQVTEMADNALKAFNTGDYAAWSRDWSGTMKAAIDEDAFSAFRDQFHAALGEYRRITAVTGSEGSASGTYRWTFEVEFENAPYRMWFGFKEGSPQIEGVNFEEPSA